MVIYHFCCEEAIHHMWRPTRMRPCPIRTDSLPGMAGEPDLSGATALS